MNAPNKKNLIYIQIPVVLKFKYEMTKKTVYQRNPFPVLPEHVDGNDDGRCWWRQTTSKKEDEMNISVLDFAWIEIESRQR